MFLSFYVQGTSSMKSSTVADKSEWRIDDIAAISYDDVKTQVLSLADSVRHAFRYLSGDFVASSVSAHPAKNVGQQEREKKDEHPWWGLAGLFKGLRGRRSPEEASIESGTVYTEGEVHAELVRVSRMHSKFGPK